MSCQRAKTDSIWASIIPKKRIENFNPAYNHNLRIPGTSHSAANVPTGSRRPPVQSRRYDRNQHSVRMVVEARQPTGPGHRQERFHSCCRNHRKADILSSNPNPGRRAARNTDQNPRLLLWDRHWHRRRRHDYCLTIESW